MLSSMAKTIWGLGNRFICRRLLKEILNELLSEIYQNLRGKSAKVNGWYAKGYEK